MFAHDLVLLADSNTGLKQSSLVLQEYTEKTKRYDVRSKFLYPKNRASTLMKKH